MIYAALLYAMLADPEFTVRESATSRLTQLVDRHPSIYGPRLAEWARTATCPETRRRSIAITRIYDHWRANSYVPASVPVWPCIDMMPAANPLIPFGLVDVRDRAETRRWYGCGSPPASTGGLEAGPWWIHYRAGREITAISTISR